MPLYTLKIRPENATNEAFYANGRLHGLHFK